jgi:predicted ArsR family transcriptional regulator
MSEPGQNKNSKNTTMDVLRQLSTLADPARQSLYEAVSDADEPMSRDAAAQAVGISRTLAAYHLDLLVDAGLLGTSFARPEGARGPGAGRPAKHYYRVQEEQMISVPPRNYELLADLLASAYEHDQGGAVQSALLDAARQEGCCAGSGSMGEQSCGHDPADNDRSPEDLFELLRQRGYEPTIGSNGDIGMRNCPFDRLSKRHTNLVCGLNHAMLSGVLEGRGEDANRATLCPRDGHCCVIIRADAPEQSHS